MWIESHSKLRCRTTVRRCWARAFSDRSDGAAVGVNALTANILCQQQNSQLSELDAAANDTWCVQREVFDLIETRRLGHAVSKSVARARKAAR